ncbi:MAG TPA: hypothetical protein VMY37_06520 [Thermoguttaceae bacterium]|nr:hypothetical protein [Thermoguttaceae bacterium]
MRTLCVGFCAVPMLLAHLAVAAEESPSLDLRRAVPAEAFMAVYGKHNPERDYQKEYFQEVWNKVQETGIIEKAVKIVTDRVPQADLEKAKSILEELREAAAPIDGKAILNADELVYAQVMRVPSSQHLVVVRLTPEAAAGAEEGIKNLMGLVEEFSDGLVTIETAEEGDAVLTTLAVPPGVPFRPTVARLDDVLLLSTCDQLARASLKMLTGGEGECKFDDPRLREALDRLPEPEDSLVFYDARQQFSELRKLGAFVREKGAGDPNADRAAKFVETLCDELAVLDYEVTVEYTEGNQNRKAAYGKVLPGVQHKVLVKVFGSGEPFAKWQTWVPAGALSYSLTTGANLHPAYERIVELLNEHVPEAKSALERFEELQAEHDVYLDRDILQAFSGERVSVSLPADKPSMLGGQDSVLALRCHKPERIRELLHRLVEQLQEIPFVKAQKLDLTECAELEGFERVTALLLNLFGAQPVVGFRDGWMFVGSNAKAVQKVFDTRAGQGETIADTEAFQQLNLEVEGPVRAISYTNLAESTRQTARLLGQVGLVAPMIIGMAGKEADSEELKPVQEILGLLPSVAKIVAKFDFLEAKLSVTQDGDEPGTYMRRTVTLVRAPAAPAETSEPAESSAPPEE